MLENKCEMGGRLRKAAEGAVERVSGNSHSRQENENKEKDKDKEHPLKMFSLKGNQICGSILIGNYNYLTQLEVNENEMEVLDLSSLAQLESLNCTHNKLTELMLNGSNLCTLQASDNCLKRVSISPVPQKLTAVDLSRNHLHELPKWLKDCRHLHSLVLSYNQLQNMTELSRINVSTQLETLDLSHNFLRVMESPLSSNNWTKRLKKLFLQDNELMSLPENFFTVLQTSLKELNLSCNKLTQLPGFVNPGVRNHSNHQQLALEKVWLTGNNLNEGVFNVLQKAPQMKVLHLAYNKISCVPSLAETCPQLEELVLSGNLLQHLPNDIGCLRSLRVLNVHSNLLLTVPPLRRLETLNTLDLSYNHLHHVNLTSILNANLKYLDISGNSQLQVDEQQVQLCRQQRKWSLIDVTGRRRCSLPTHTALQMDKFNPNDDTGDSSIGLQKGCGRRVPWQLGFSETPGHCRKLLVAQLREQVYRRDEALIGMFASEMSSMASSTRMMQAISTHILQASRASAVVQRQPDRSTNADMIPFLTQSFLTLRRVLSDQPMVGGVLCHLTWTHQHGQRAGDPGRLNVRSQKTRRYVLRLVGCGNIGVYLVRRTYNVQLHPVKRTNGKTVISSQQEANNSLAPEGGVVDCAAEDQPDLVEWCLNNDDEYLVLCNAEISTHLDIDRIAREIRKDDNVMLAAKRLQNVAQSFGSQGNLSAIVVRFRNLSTDVDSLINELKRSVKGKPYSLSKGKRNCCGTEHNSVVGKHHCPVTSVAFMGQLAAGRSERSSPSGQSDRTANVLGGRVGANGGGEYVLAHARVLEETTELEMLDDTDSALSEEQFKCWEYMLEQNTQLLFDKELNTISRSFVKNRERFEKKPAKILDRYDNGKTTLLNNANSRFMSSSSPHLLYADMRKPLAAAQEGCSHFLSRHFGSARSFGAFGYDLFDGGTELGQRSAGKVGMATNLNPMAAGKLGGGPNAAYFGSLQRLMPYNLEYDFVRRQQRNLVLDKGHLPLESGEVILSPVQDNDVDGGEVDACTGDGQDCGNDHCGDDLFGEHQTRMQKYWGVATTEL